jgi:endoglucanase
MNKHLVLLPLSSLAVGLLLLAGRARPEGPAKDAFAYNRLLGRGINLGNALDAPQEGAWGFRLKAEYFPLIKKAGFNSVRIPIRWSAHAGQGPPYTIDPAFFRRVDWAVDQALKQGLVAVINVHHYEEMFREPQKHFPRLLGLWRQIASHYKDRPEQLYFELLNEPNGALKDELWAEMVPKLLAVVRQSNPRRIVIVGPGHWNNLTKLDSLRLPEEDRMLIVTFHYYEPFHFTHQAASWVKGSEKWKGTTWTGAPSQRAALAKDLDRAAAWSKKHGRPLYLGEFGAYSAADMDSRVRWTRAVARGAEQRGMSWAYWEFGSGFGAYDPETGRWRQPLLEALVDHPSR